MKQDELMKTNHKLALAALTGISIGVATAQAIHAQQVKAPPSYVIAEVEKDPSKVEDPAAARKYVQEAPKSLPPFTGQCGVRGGPLQAVGGGVQRDSMVVIASDSWENSGGWYYSPAYEAIKPIRQNSTKSRI